MQKRALIGFVPLRGDSTNRKECERGGRKIGVPADRQAIFGPSRLNPLLTAVLLVFVVLLAAGSPGRAAEYPRRPKLVLILVIDQFRYDYLVRFRQQFGPGGFNLLLAGGATFADCRYDYATLATGPGHATLLTGAYSNEHGIIANEWYDRLLHRPVYCVEDRGTKEVSDSDPSTAASGFSPWNLIGSTLGDELRAATNFQSKVVAISLKDRAAVLMGGHSPSAVYWYNPSSGRFVTSTYYMPALPSWVAAFNRNSPAKHYCGKPWIALPGTPGGNGAKLSEFKQARGTCPDEKFLGWLDQTPFMNEIELGFALQAVKNEHLGQGTDTDMLAVSLSVNDYIGHAVGPYSAKVADTTLRTDAYLASFFAELDKAVGLKNVWMALSADHGVAPNPDFIESHKWGAGHMQPAAIREGVEAAMTAAFGQGKWVEASDEFNLYLNHDELKAHGIEISKAEEVAAKAAASAPGVTAAFTRTQLATGRLPSSRFARAASNSFNLHRGGDVFIVLDPYALPVSGSQGTTHGTPWSYDSQVPLILWGSTFRPGIYFNACQPIDLAATLAAVLGLTQPSGALTAELQFSTKGLTEEQLDQDRSQSHCPACYQRNAVRLHRDPIDPTEGLPVGD